MNLTVFGATGRTGQRIVTQALRAGHSVRVFVRNPTRLPAGLDLQVFKGDALDPVAVDRALAPPVDAVICTLGIFHREPRTELSDGTGNIIAGMQNNNIGRLAACSSLGVGDSKGQGNFVARNFQKFMLARVLEDKERQEVLIRNSGLDWTIVRPPRLTDADRIDEDVVVWQGPSPTRPKLSWATSRATVARLLLTAVETGQHSLAAVNISSPK